MPPKAKFAAIFFCFVAIGYVIFNAVDEAMTEKLDDDTIKEIYKQADSLIKNPQGMHDFMQKRLHDIYTRKGSLITSARDKPDETKPVSLNKAQTIEMMAREMGMMTITKYEHKIVGIQYTPDHQYAYVSSTESSSGTINFTLPGGKTVSLPFNDGSSCIDTLAQFKKALTFVQSSCTSKLAFIQ